MLSAGMLTDFASATIVRRRGLLSTSPPPARAATVSSLMMRVKTLPRLASAAPFLCLIVCHFEWPDIAETPVIAVKRGPDMLSQGLGSAGSLAEPSGLKGSTGSEGSTGAGSRAPRVRFSPLRVSGSRLGGLDATSLPGRSAPVEPEEPPNQHP